MGKEQSFPFSNASPQTGYPSTSDVSVATAPASENGSNNHTKASGTLIQQTTQPTPSEKRPCGHNPADSSEGQPRNGRARPEVRARSQLLPRYWPRITDQELQQISGEYPYDRKIVISFCDTFDIALVLAFGLWLG